ncbi:MAG: hypothetical protein AAF495_25400 [Pseudomonadota bacterium]
MTTKDDIRRLATASAIKLFSQKNPGWGRDVVTSLFEHANDAMALSLDTNDANVATRQLLTVAGTLVTKGEFDVSAFVDGPGKVNVSAQGNLDDLSPLKKLALANQLEATKRDEQAKAARESALDLSNDKKPDDFDTWRPMRKLAWAREQAARAKQDAQANTIISQPADFDKLSPREKLAFANSERFKQDAS